MIAQPFSDFFYSNPFAADKISSFKTVGFIPTSLRLLFKF
ncbi:hypothetical protein J699_00442 [Acinetobacter sp. 1000160]|nr:hypothetical protein J522_2619 [Acinetobacter baumannii 146457]EYT23538.1 hypothetical protein J699_00442 [Acinetobacter sp. 1000160]